MKYILLLPPIKNIKNINLFTLLNKYLLFFFFTHLLIIIYSITSYLSISLFIKGIEDILFKNTCIVFNALNACA